MIPTVFEIFMMVALVLMFILVLTAIACMFVLSGRTAKQLMARNLAEYEAYNNPKDKEKPVGYMTDEQLYWQNRQKQDDLNKKLQKNIQLLKKEEEAFEFNVERNG